MAGYASKCCRSRPQRLSATVLPNKHEHQCERPRDRVCVASSRVRSMPTRWGWSSRAKVAKYEKYAVRLVDDGLGTAVPLTPARYAWDDYE